MEHLENDTDSRMPKYEEKNLSQSHFVNHKSYTGRPDIEVGLSSDRLATNCQSHSMAPKGFMQI
jgi:hypothetical protein